MSKLKLVEIYRRNLAVKFLSDSENSLGPEAYQIHRDRDYLLNIVSRCHGVMLQHELSEIDEQDALDQIFVILADA